MKNLGEDYRLERCCKNCDYCVGNPEMCTANNIASGGGKLIQEQFNVNTYFCKDFVFKTNSQRKTLTEVRNKSGGDGVE